MQGTGANSARDPSSQSWWIRDLILAAGFLTRLPLPVIEPGDRQLLRTGWCFPLVGAGIGVAGGLLAWISHGLGLPAVACALVACAAFCAALIVFCD